MRWRFLFIICLVGCLLLSGCDAASIKPQATEPVGDSSWVKGESPVPNRRMGLDRNFPEHTANGENGIYLLDRSFIYYLENGTDVLIPLCGRPDCTHNSADCNAYIVGSEITYYDGFLYVFCGGSDAKIVRMDPDGSNHVTVIDLMESVNKIGGERVSSGFVTEGYCVFSISKMVEVDDGDGSDISQQFKEQWIGSFYCKIDGSQGEPKVLSGKHEEISVSPLYSCGNIILAFANEPQNGGEYASYWQWHPETDTYTYLMDTPRYSGYYDDTAGYYHMDGAIRRYTIATGKEEVMAQTGLTGAYHVRAFPDCLVLFTSSKEDYTLYVYNWAYELVEAVDVGVCKGKHMPSVLIGETPDRFILSDAEFNYYYISKSELGNGTAEVHSIEIL
jgi:hypothetical protein